MRCKIEAAGACGTRDTEATVKHKKGSESMGWRNRNSREQIVGFQHQDLNTYFSSNTNPVRVSGL